MSVYSARRSLLPMTPVSTHPAQYTQHPEPAIVDYTYEDDYPVPPFHPKSISYSACVDTSSFYPPSCTQGGNGKREPIIYSSLMSPTIPMSSPTPPPVLLPSIVPAGSDAELSTDHVVTHLVPPVDMGMAKKGTVSASPGFETPIAAHAAFFAAWFWFASRSTNLITSPSTSPTSALFNDRRQDTSTTFGSINPLQVHISPAFQSFVAHLLRITSVSHSVVLIALLYLSRLTQKHGPCGGPGSEHGAFVVSLMLANKYLDDNTYTNRTWADLSQLTIGEVNRLEQFLLQCLDWNLRVEQADFATWTKFLDGFMLTRQRQSQRQHAFNDFDTIVSASSTLPSTETFLDTPRARSLSPRETFSEPSGQPVISPSQARKRSAGDAFQVDDATTIEHDQAVKSMRVPSRHGFVHLPGASQLNQSAGAALGRASSLSRAARSEFQAGRRGSTPGLSLHQHQPAQSLQQSMPSYLASQAPESVQQFNLAAADRHTQEHEAYALSQQQYQAVPEHLVFYTLAAEAHPGQDGSRRKGTLHYQIPQAQIMPPTHHSIDQRQQALVQPSYTAAQSYPYAVHYPASTSYAGQPLTPGYMPHPNGAQAQPLYTPAGFSPTIVGGPQDYISSALPTPNSFGHPLQHYAFGQPAIPAPAQFANAGPTAYQYQPNGYDGHQQQLYGVPHNYPFAPSIPQHVNGLVLEGGWDHAAAAQTQYTGPHVHHQASQARAMMQSRSEWSSPMFNHGMF